MIHDYCKYLVDTINFNSSNSTKNKLEITQHFKTSFIYTLNITISKTLGFFPLMENNCLSLCFLEKYSIQGESIDRKPDDKKFYWSEASFGESD